MVKTSNLEDTLNNYRTLKDTSAYNKVAYFADYHRAGNLKNVAYNLVKEANGKDVYVVLQDIDEKKDRLRIFQEIGYQDPQSTILAYTLSKLDTEEEQELFQYISAVQTNGGIEQYMQLLKQYYGLSDDKLKGELQRFSKGNKKFKELGLELKIQNIHKNNQDEIQKITTISQLQGMALDRSISQYNLSEVGKEVLDLNKELKEQGYGQVKLIVGGGNHDSIYDSAVLKQILGEENVYEANEITGAIELGNGDDKISFQVAGNTYGINHPSDMMYYPEEMLAKLYPHMYQEQTIVEDYDSKNKVSLDDALKSREYSRITNNNTENKTLDFLLTHMEFGSPMGFEDKSKQIYPNLDSLGLIYITQNNLKRDEEGYSNVYSGHLHSEATKKDDNWMQNKHRSYAYIIGKDSAEMLNDVEGAHPQLEYDMEKLEKITEHEMMQLAQMYGVDLKYLGIEIETSDKKVA